MPLTLSQYIIQLSQIAIKLPIKTITEIIGWWWTDGRTEKVAPFWFAILKSSQQKI